MFAGPTTIIVAHLRKFEPGLQFSGIASGEMQATAPRKARFLQLSNTSLHSKLYKLVVHFELWIPPELVTSVIFRPVKRSSPIG